MIAQERQVPEVDFQRGSSYRLQVVRQASHQASIRIWAWSKVSSSVNHVSPADLISYTTFDLSHFKIEEDHVVADDTIQKTNEQFEGDAGLYDFLVSIYLQIRIIAEISMSLL